MKEQWCWIFNIVATFAVRPEYLDPSFDSIINDAGTKKLTYQQKKDYMDALHLNERERLVVQEGGYILGKEDGLKEGREEGREERNREIAKEMLASGMEVALVIKCTGLSEEEVASLG